MLRWHLWHRHAELSASTRVCWAKEVSGVDPGPSMLVLCLHQWFWVSLLVKICQSKACLKSPNRRLKPSYISKICSTSGSDSNRRTCTGHPWHRTKSIAGYDGGPHGISLHPYQQLINQGHCKQCEEARQQLAVSKIWWASALHLYPGSREESVQGAGRQGRGELSTGEGARESDSDLCPPRLCFGETEKQLSNYGHGKGEKNNTIYKACWTVSNTFVFSKLKKLSNKKILFFFTLLIRVVFFSRLKRNFKIMKVLRKIEQMEFGDPCR